MITCSVSVWKIEYPSINYCLILHKIDSNLTSVMGRVGWFSTLPESPGWKITKQFLKISHVAVKLKRRGMQRHRIPSRRGCPWSNFTGTREQRCQVCLRNCNRNEMKPGENSSQLQGLFFTRKSIKSQNRSNPINSNSCCRPFRIVFS